MQRLACATGIILAMLALAAPALAKQHFPARPVQVIVPATPGGPVDTAVRLIEPALASALGQSVVLISKTGRQRNARHAGSRDRCP